MTKGKFAALAAAVASVAMPAAAGAQEAAAPVAPKGEVASLVLPGRDADGGWATPNRGLSGGETIWHLRTALNVAALGCRGDGEAATVAGYNALLADERQALSEAAAAVEATYRGRAGAAWQARFDDDMTRLYNFWAQPGAHDGFCAEATAVLREAATVEPGDFGAFAATALPRLEAPFLSFFEAVAEYRAAAAAWRAGQAPAVMVAAAAQASTDPAAPTDQAPPVMIAAATPVAIGPTLP